MLNGSVYKKTYAAQNDVVCRPAGPYRGYMAPGARNKFGAPMFYSKVFWK